MCGHVYESFESLLERRPSERERLPLLRRPKQDLLITNTLPARSFHGSGSVSLIPKDQTHESLLYLKDEW